MQGVTWKNRRRAHIESRHKVHKLHHPLMRSGDCLRKKMGVINKQLSRGAFFS